MEAHNALAARGGKGAAMATTTISGTNKLAERIIAEAEAEAALALERAEEEARGIRLESERTITDQRAQLSTRRDAAAKAVRDGYKTRASLDAQKSALAKKRAVIDRAFEEAYQALLKLGAEERERLCERMLRAEAEGGELVLPAKADRAGVQRAIKNVGRGLRLSSEDAQIDGGFVLVGEGYEKDCSFRSLTGVLRDGEETNAARKLFD